MSVDEDTRRAVVEALAHRISVTTAEQDGKRRPRVRVRYAFDGLGGLDVASAHPRA